MLLKRIKYFFPVLLLGYALFAAPTMSVAQSVPPEYEAIGMQYKGFSLKPTLEVETIYNSNLFAQKENEQSDYIVNLKPALLVEKEYDGHQFSFGASGEIERHKDFQNQNKENYYAYFKGLIAPSSNWQFPLTLEAEKDTRDRSDPVENDTISTLPTDVHRYSGSLGVVRRFNRLSVSLIGQYTDVSLDDGTSLDGGTPLIFSDTNRTTTAGTLTFSYDFPRGEQSSSVEHSVFASFRLGKQSFEKGQFVNGSFSGIKPDRTDKGVLAGFNTSYKKLIFAKLGAGVIRQDFDDSSIESIQSMDFLADIQYNILPKLTLGFDARREILQDNEISLGIVRSDFDFTTDYELLHNIHIGSNLGYTEFDFTEANRTDQDYTAAAFLKYFHSNNLESTLRAQYRTRESDIADREFDNYILLFSVTGKL